MKLTFFFFVFSIIAFTSAGKINVLFDQIKDSIDQIKNSLDSFIEIYEKEKITGICNCRLKTANRIIGGEKATKNSMPWQVSLAHLNNYHFCGGFILNKNYILTSRYCLDNLQADQIKVRVGTNDLNDPNIEFKTYPVDSFILHDFVDLLLPGNIALLKLKIPISLEEGIAESACLNLNPKEYTENFLVSGWGITESSYKNLTDDQQYMGQISSTLKQSVHELFDDSKCSDFSICVKPIYDGESICHGDFGAPLIYIENGHTTIEGIASYVYNFTTIGEKVMLCNGPSAFSRLSYYKEWIEQNIGDKYCS